MSIMHGERYNIEIKEDTAIITDKTKNIIIKRKIVEPKKHGLFIRMYVRLKGQLVSLERLISTKEKVY